MIMNKASATSASKAIATLLAPNSTSNLIDDDYTLFPVKDYVIGIENMYGSNGGTGTSYFKYVPYASDFVVEDTPTTFSHAWCAAGLYKGVLYLCSVTRSGSGSSAVYKGHTFMCYNGDAWTVLAAPTGITASVGARKLVGHDNKIYVFSNNTTINVFNLSTGTWSYNVGTLPYQADTPISFSGSIYYLSYISARYYLYQLNTSSYASTQKAMTPNATATQSYLYIKKGKLKAYCYSDANSSPGSWVWSGTAWSHESYECWPSNILSGTSQSSMWVTDEEHVYTSGSYGSKTTYFGPTFELYADK